MTFALQDHDFYQKGILPYPGGPLEQPAQVVALFNVIDQEMAKAAKITQNINDAKQKARNKRDGGMGVAKGRTVRANRKRRRGRK